MERFANFHRIVKINDNIELPSLEVEFHCPDLMTRHARPGNGGRGFSLQHVPSLRELMKTLTVTANGIFDGLVRKTRRIIPVHYTVNNLLSVDTVVVKFEEATRLGCGGSKYCDDDKYMLWRGQLFHRERMTTILSGHTPSLLDTSLFRGFCSPVNRPSDVVYDFVKVLQASGIDSRSIQYQTCLYSLLKCCTFRHYHGQSPVRRSVVSDVWDGDSRRQT